MLKPITRYLRTFARLGLCGAALLALLTACGPASPEPAAPALDGRIAFVSERHTQVFGVSVSVSYGLYVLDLGAPDASGFVIVPDDALLSHPTWSPSGERLMAYRMTYDAERGYRRRIVLADARAPYEQEIFEDAWIGRSPAWSPDGQQVAFSNGSTIRIYDVETRQQRKVLEAPGGVWDPTWSPDGRRIAFRHSPDVSASPGLTAARGIAVLGVEDGAFLQLTFNEADMSPAWSPDDRIAFQREGDIYVMACDGTQVTRLTRDGQSFSPAWSPDGESIAFLSSRNRECGAWFLDSPPFCTNGLYVMDADGSHVRLLRQEDERIGDLVWGF